MTSEPECMPRTESPDGFTGVILGLESFRDVDVVLHGPTGCRGPHSYLSERLLARRHSGERMNFADPLYFGQPRIPTTALDGHDIVFGARGKLEEALKRVAPRGSGPLAIVNSPGAALIGDDLLACAREIFPGRPCAIVEMPSISAPFAEGYQQGVVAMLEALDPAPAPIRPRTVSLLGLGIGHAGWEGSLAELIRLLGLCGLEVSCAPGAGASLEACQSLPSAEVFAVVHAPFSESVAAWVQARFPGRVVEGPLGAPIGYPALEAWLRAVAEAAGVDPSPAVQEIQRERNRVAHLLLQCSEAMEELRGAPLAVHLEASLALPLVQWFYEYVGLLPVSVMVRDGRDSNLARSLEKWLAAKGLSDAWERSWACSEVALLLSDGAEAQLARTLGVPALALEMPVDPVPAFLPEPILGCRGTTRFLEQVVREVF